MIITRLKLKNYRRYRDVDIEFPTGPIGIVGRNGVGKSTLLEAIGWCMYGGKVRTPQDEIKTTDVDDECLVILEMIINDSTIKIERKITKSGAIHAKLFVNNSTQPKVHTPNEVGKYVEKEITKMNSKLFFSTIFTKQKELNVFSDMDNAERKQTIEKLLGIGMIDKAHKNIRANMNDNINEMDLISGQLKNIDSLNNDLEEKISEKNLHMEKHKQIKTSVVAALDSRKKNKMKFEKFDEKYKKHNKYILIVKTTQEKETAENDKLKKIKIDISSTIKSKNELKDLEPSIKNYDIISKKLNRLNILYAKYVEMNGIMNELNDYESKIDSDGRLIATYEEKLNLIKNPIHNMKQMKSILKKLNDTRNEKTTKTATIISLHKNCKSSYNDQKKEQNNLKKLGEKSKCPTCKKTLGNNYELLMKNINENMIKINNDMENYINIENDLNGDIKDLNDQIRENEKLLKDINDDNIKRDELKTKLTMIKKEIKKSHLKKSILNKKISNHKGKHYSKEEHDSIKQEHTKLEKKYTRSLEIKNESKKLPRLIKTQENCRKNMLTIKTKLKSYSILIKNMNFDESQYDESKTAHIQSIEKHEELQREESNMKNNIDMTTQAIEYIEKSIDENNELQQKYSIINKKQSELEKLDKNMVQFRLHLIHKIRPSLSHKTSKMLRNMTNGKYPIVELDDDYKINIVHGKHNFDIDRFSGGEIDLANLCFRIAISAELAERSGNSTSGFIALDEIFGSQDSGRKTNILEQLILLSRQFKQILLITHIEDVRDRLPFTLFIKEGSDGNIFVEPQGDPTFATNNVK